MEHSEEKFAANRHLAHKLHEELVRECKEQGFNRLDNNYFPQDDRLLRSVVIKYREDKRKEDLFEADTIQKYGDMAQKRLEIRVPKYSAKFWRKWNKDLAILEDATQKETDELEAAKVDFETLKRKGKIPKRARFPVGSAAAAIRQVKELVEASSVRDQLPQSLRPSTSLLSSTTRKNSRLGSSIGSRTQSRGGKCLVRYDVKLESDTKLNFIDPACQSKESKQLGLSDLTIHLMRCKASGDVEKRRIQTAAAGSQYSRRISGNYDNRSGFRGPQSAPTSSFGHYGFKTASAHADKLNALTDYANGVEGAVVQIQSNGTEESQQPDENMKHGVTNDDFLEDRNRTDRNPSLSIELGSVLNTSALQDSGLQLGSSFMLPQPSELSYSDDENSGSGSGILGHIEGESTVGNSEIFASMRITELPATIGTRDTKGGVWSQAEERKNYPKSLTKNCDTPPVDRVRGEPKLATFSSAPRFTVQAEKTGSFENNELAITAGGRAYSASTGVQFSRISRGEDGDIGGEVGKDAKYNPGPGEYNITGIFDKDRQKSPTRELPYIDMETALGKRSGIVDLPSAIVAKMVGFGYGCKKEEHELYGMCLDGMCGRRGRWEDVMLTQNDRPRTQGRDSSTATAVPLSASANRNKAATPNTTNAKPGSALQPTPEKAEKRRHPPMRMLSAGGGHIELPSISIATVTSAGTVDHFPMPGDAVRNDDDPNNNSTGAIRRISIVPDRPLSHHEAERLPTPHTLNNSSSRVNTAASARSDKSRDDEKEKDSIYGKSRGGTTGIIGDEVLSPIQIAALKGDAKLVRELSAPHLKVDVNFANPESGLTALHIAAIEFQMECIAALKEAFPQLDLQPRDKRWDTPLHWAARKGYEDVVTMLCDIGCSTAIRNKKGKLPIEVVANYRCHRALAFAAERESLVNEYDKLHQKCESFTDLNAQRIAMGLKPLLTIGTPGSTSRSREGGSRSGRRASSRGAYRGDDDENCSVGSGPPRSAGGGGAISSRIGSAALTARSDRSRRSSRKSTARINYEDYDIEEVPVVKTIFDDPSYNKLKDPTWSSFEVGFLQED